MGLVAGGADLVAGGRGLAFGLVAAAARRRLHTGVRLVTRGALLVSLIDELALVLVAVGAGDLLWLRAMRQAEVAVQVQTWWPLLTGGLVNALAVAALTGRDVAELEAEFWCGLVAVGAAGAAVRAVIGVGEAVA